MFNAALLRRAAMAAEVLFLALTCAGAQDYSLAALLDPATAAEIAQKGSVSAVASDHVPRLLPHLAAAEPISAALAAERPKIQVEALFLYRRSAPKSPSERSAELAAIYGLMRSISTLRGIQYYSQTQKSMEVLYMESYRVASLADRTPVADEAPPLPGAVPASESLLAFHQDQRFGKNVYRYDFAVRDDTVLVESTNETRMSYGIIPVFAPEQLRMRLLVVPTNEGILFYVESGGNAPGLLASHIGESFKNRAAALYGWFRDRFASLSRP